MDLLKERQWSLREKIKEATLQLLSRTYCPGFPSAAVIKNPPASAADKGGSIPGSIAGLIPGWGRSPGGGNGNPPPVVSPGEFHVQRNLAGYSQRVTKSQTQLSMQAEALTAQRVSGSETGEVDSWCWTDKAKFWGVQSWQFWEDRYSDRSIWWLFLFSFKYLAECWLLHLHDLFKAWQANATKNKRKNNWHSHKTWIMPGFTSQTEKQQQQQKHNS